MQLINKAHAGFSKTSPRVNQREWCLVCHMVSTWYSYSNNEPIFLLKLFCNVGRHSRSCILSETWEEKPIHFPRSTNDYSGNRDIRNRGDKQFHLHYDNSIVCRSFIYCFCHTKTVVFMLLQLLTHYSFCVNNQMFCMSRGTQMEEIAHFFVSIVMFSDAQRCHGLHGENIKHTELGAWKEPFFLSFSKNVLWLKMIWVLKLRLTRVRHVTVKIDIMQ